jgi:PAS domain S-box-containing protein
MKNPISRSKADFMVSERVLVRFKSKPDQKKKIKPFTAGKTESLCNAEERYEAILEGIEEGYFEVDLAGNMAFFNKALCRISGYPREKLLGMNNRDYTDPETAKTMFAIFHEIYTTGKPAKVKDYKIIRQDGASCTVELSASLMRDSNGEPLGFRGIVRDVTERITAQEALIESEKRYRKLFEDSLDAIVITDRKGNFFDLNEAALNLFGYSKEEISEIPFPQLYVEQEDSSRFQRDMEAKGAVSDFEVKLRRKDGSIMTCVLFATARRANGKGVVGYQGIVRDISTQRATEEALRESEEKYRQLLNHAPAGIYEVDFIKRTFIDVNDVMCEYTGYSKEELLSLSPFDILNEDSKRHFMERMTKMLSGEKVPETVEYKIKGKNGREFWVLLNSKLVYENGFPKGATAVVHDISERKLAEEAIRKSEERYRLLVDHANDGIFIAQQGKVKFSNPRTLEILGYDSDELSTLPYMALIHPDDRAIVQRAKDMRGINGESSSIYSIRVRTKAGKQIWAQISSVPIFWEDQPATLNFVRDITVQKTAEDELKQTIEKLRKATGATIQAMAQTVEVRDPYTAGHQRRVSNIARAIATAMALPSEMIEGIRMAGNIHDIGKISVPAEILSKPGSLTDIEFALIKAHPKTGYDILKGIEFPWNIARIVLQHHERLDGSGYPQGLCGEDILLEARILAVADVVEAMASHRPYRPALGLEKAVEEIRSKKNRLYDAGVVEAFEKALAAGHLEFK